MPDVNERLRCWALGVRLEEQVVALERAVRGLTLRVAPGEADVRRGLISTQVRIIRELVDSARVCGIGAGSDTLRSVEDLEENLSKMAGGYTSEMNVEGAARTLGRGLHGDAITHAGEPLPGA